MTDPVRERVIEVVARSQNKPRDQISLDTSFEELGMSSLDALALIFDLEEEFNVNIPNDEAMRIRDVRQAVESLERLVSGSASKSGTAPVE